MNLSLQQIEELLSKITQGEWNLNETGWCHESDVFENQKLIAVAPTIIRQLIKERNAFREVAIEQARRITKIEDGKLFLGVGVRSEAEEYIDREANP